MALRCVRMMSASARGMAVGLAVLVLLASTITRAATPAREVVERFHESLLSMWKQADELTTMDRYDRMQAPVQAAFDLEQMIQIASGPAWRDASDAEREALLAAFTRYSVANYASRFDSYGGQSFATLGEAPGPGGRVIVDTQIVIPNDEAVPISYVLEGNDGPLRIVDVVAKGVSELARLRAEYRSVVKSAGAAGLARKIDDLASSLLAE